MGVDVELTCVMADGTIRRGPRKLGLYRIYWAEGGSSLASVGMGYDGHRWLAPANWTKPGTDPQVWDLVLRARLLKGA